MGHLPSKLVGHFRCVPGIALAAAASFLLAKYSAGTAATSVVHGWGPRVPLICFLGTKAFLSSWTLAK